MKKESANNQQNKRGRGKGNGDKRYTYANSKRDSREHDTRDFSDIKKCDMDKLVSNDISYYNKDKNLFDQTTRIPWDAFLGDRINRTEVAGNDLNAPFPGIMRVDFIHGPGSARTTTDAVNRAVTRLMGEIYAQTNASSLPYTQADLAMWITTTSSIAMNIAIAKRALECANFWITRNLYYPKALIKSMGFLPDDIILHRDEYCAKLNVLIQDFNALKVPNIVDTYSRQYSLCHNIYVDEDSVLGQIFYFMPDGYYLYDDTTSTATWNDMPNIVNAGHALSSILNIIQQQLEAWRHSQVLYYMMGSLLRAFKSNEFYTIDGVTIFDMISPKVDEIMSLQLMNCTIFNYQQFDKTSLNITQDVMNDTLLWVPKTLEQSPSDLIAYQARLKYMLRAYKAEVSADDIMEMTRLTNLPDYRTTQDSKVYLEFEGCSPEIICNLHVIFYDRSTGDISYNTISWSQINLYHNNTTAINELVATINTTQALTNFRYIPTIWINIWPNPTSPLPESSNVLGDIYNYTYISKPDLIALHRCAAYSMYALKVGDIKLNA